MTVVPLKRRFIVWNDKERGDPEVMRFTLASQEGLTWEDLLAKHRVVILAEAGSGKSTELSEQARLSSEAGRYTFSATVQTVGGRGLTSALGVAASRKLNEWHTSDRPAWFFFDSVDEAKARDIRFEEALREIADGIEGAASRAHIVLSGRHTDWEFRRDLKNLEEWIAMPAADLIAPAIDPNELLISVVRRDKAPEPPPPVETPLVVVMGALDRSQVQAFACGKGVPNVDAFLRALDKSNLWGFARRPLDLDWLVSYWRSRGTFGPLANMLEHSLQERLREPDLQRERKDPVDPDRAMVALERIGAGLVLQRLRDIAVPDSSLDLSEGRSALDLAEILPDWSGQDRARLISRPVFDPASAGLARLHNDSQGDVRSFLTARWLKRLTEANCPKAVIRDLLFATTYGTCLVIPSMRQTAAWLSLWSPDVAREVIARDPRLLMDAGDPASLPLPVREQALKAVVAQVLDDEELNMPDQDNLQRFALLDMAPCLRNIWAKYSGSPAVRKLLLLMIWLGELTACADLAVAASFGIHADRYSQVFAGRALMAVASDTEKQRYAGYIKDHAGAILSVLVWDAVEMLFPTVLSVDDLLLILKSVDVKGSGGLGLDYVGPKLAERLESAAQAERLIAGLLGGLQAQLDPARHEENSNDELYLSTIKAAGRRLLELSAPTQASNHAIDAALRLGETRHNKLRRRRKDEAPDLFSLLAATPQRRRLALWRAAERFADAKLGGKKIINPWQIEILGFSPDLRLEDFDWLLEDAEYRRAPNERQIATNAALQLWRQSGERPDQFARIQRVGDIHADVAAVVEEWTRPQSPSEEEHARNRNMRQVERRNAAESAERDQSWRDFADRLRADPDQLRAIKPPTDKGVDDRLYHVWHLLNAVGKNQSRYSIDDLAPLEPMFGPPVVAALRDAFVAYWRRWSPKLRCERPAEQRNMISDCIGIVGVTLETAGCSTWAVQLPYDDAVRAATYATLELNGFPSWFASLARAQPDAVREVLTRALAPELEAGEATDRLETLQDISEADVAISSLLADQLFEHLRQNETLPPVVLTPMLRILVAAQSESDALASLLRARFECATAVQKEAIYLVSLFDLDPAQATAALDIKLAALPPDKQTVLVQAILSKLFRDGWREGTRRPGDVPLKSLERLVLMAFTTIRVGEDKDHSDGQAYSPDSRDDAETARGALFKALIDTPGLATFDAIDRLSKTPEFPIGQARMMQIARDRAEQDSEREAWSSADICAFETDFMTAPRNPLDLQRLALQRLADLQYDLKHADYAQGATVARLPNEVDVQNWMADRLRGIQGRSYSIEREPHVVEEKEPDIRFRAKASDANVPIEIKVPESCSLNELEDALKVQLMGQYLRDGHNRYGILLLVHKQARSRGWQTAAGDWLTFEQVAEHLRGLARSIAAKESLAPQAEIAVVDVSAFAEG